MKTALMISISAASMLVGALYLNNETDITQPVFSGTPQEQQKVNLELAKKINNKTFSQVKFKRFNLASDELPSSLAGLNHGIKLGTDDNGNLILNDNIKDLFEFYMSAMGEESLEKIILRIQSDMSAQLRSAALNQGLSLLKRYIDYKIELSELESGSIRYAHTHDFSDIEKIKYQKQQLNDMRLTHFDETEYQHFFAEEDEYDTFMLQHLEITQDTSLDALQKQIQLKELQSSLPSHIQETRHQVSLHGDLQQETQALKNKGGSSEEIYQLRENALGREVAQALTELDYERQRWQARVDGFINEKEEIANSGLSHDDQTQAIEDLLIKNFSGPERIRANALANL